VRLNFSFGGRGAWKTSTFKKYNFEAEGIPALGGALHPLLKVREEIRNIFLEMGFASPLACPSPADHDTPRFAEMATSSFVESGFWCFDALFVPQQHPARELQDTFYLSGIHSRVPVRMGYLSNGVRSP
jgi:phenylalanyl-tRNA synthetase alpha chain